MNNKSRRESLHNLFAEILPAAGELIMSYRSQPISIAEKEKNEIVTPTDIAVNNVIIERLAKAFPDISVYSEEGGAEYKSTATTRWIIAPRASPSMSQMKQTHQTCF